jgi:hypothetical protein
VPQDLFVVRGLQGTAALQIAISERGVTAFQKPPDSMGAAAGRFTELLKDVFYDFEVRASAWVPFALIYGKGADSPAVAARVQAAVDKLAAEAKAAEEAKPA